MTFTLKCVKLQLKLRQINQIGAMAIRRRLLHSLTAIIAVILTFLYRIRILQFGFFFRQLQLDFPDAAQKPVRIYAQS